MAQAAAAIPYIYYGVVGISAAVGAYSVVSQSRAQAAWGKYNAKVAERNAMMAKLGAEKEAGRKRAEVRKLLARQRAVYGKAGVEFEGSPLLVMADTAAEGELDALLIEYRGLTQSQAQRSQAELDRMKARATKRAGWYGAGQSLLGGAARAGSYYQQGR